uniref:Palmitoyltransferase n=2 Tax=Rhinopithecus TaxID=542827 RepID=A0A2K6KLL8_RHIBE
VYKMNICNKPSNKTAPEKSVWTAPPAQPSGPSPELQGQRSRRNGWSWPPHPLQIVAWLLYLFFAVIGFGVLVPLLPHHWVPAGYACMGAIFAGHLVVHLTAVSIDPADANVRDKSYAGPLPIFNRSQHAHVIEDLHCNLCDVDVSARSKHCSACNKCVCGFDHHCKWLNNCVGERNYRLFLHSVASAFLGVLLLVLVATYVFVEFFVNPMRLRTNRHFEVLKNHTDVWFVFLPAAPVETQAPAILALAALLILLGLLSIALLGHLLCFHIYLMWHKLTTYEYIVQHRPPQEAKGVHRELESCPPKMRPIQEMEFYMRTFSHVRPEPPGQARPAAVNAKHSRPASPDPTPGRRDCAGPPVQVEWDKNKPLPWRSPLLLLAMWGPQSPPCLCRKRGRGACIKCRRLKPRIGRRGPGLPAAAPARRRIPRAPALCTLLALLAPTTRRRQSPWTRYQWRRRAWAAPLWPPHVARAESPRWRCRRVRPPFS